MSSNPRRGVPPAAGAPYSTSYSPNEEIGMSAGKKLYTLVILIVILINSFVIFFQLPDNFWDATGGVMFAGQVMALVNVFFNVHFNR